MINSPDNNVIPSRAEGLARINEIQQLTELLLAEQENLKKDIIQTTATLIRCIHLCKQVIPRNNIIYDKWLQIAQGNLEMVLNFANSNITTLLQAMQVELETLPQRN